jgi:hypothetical protein
LLLLLLLVATHRPTDLLLAVVGPAIIMLHGIASYTKIRSNVNIRSQCESLSCFASYFMMIM